MKRSSQVGFSIIELSVALTIAGILLALGAPSMSGYLQNARLGSLAQNMYSGLQLARTEAVKRNQNVEFVMTNSSLESATADTVVLNSTGRNWVVRYQTSASAAYSLVEQKSSNSSEAANVAIAASGPQFIFGSLGQVVSLPGGIALSNPTLGLCTPAGPVRCWNVVVAPGGQVRLCSPDTSLPAGDSRAC